MNGPLDILASPDGFRAWLTERRGEIVGAIGEGYECPIHNYLSDALPNGTNLSYVGVGVFWIGKTFYRLPIWAFRFIGRVDWDEGEEDETSIGKRLVSADRCLELMEGLG